MFLYDKKQNSIEVYSLETTNDALMDFRQEELKRIEHPILSADSLDYSYTPILPFEKHKGEYRKYVLSYNSLNTPSSDLHRHRIQESSQSKRNKEILLDSYYYGFLSDREIACASQSNDFRYFLLKNNKYTASPQHNVYRTMDDIIELPESLYILQMIEQEYFNFVSDIELSKVLEIYDLKYLDSLDVSIIEKMDSLGITDGKQKELLEKIPYHRTIIQKKKAK